MEEQSGPRSELSLRSSSSSSSSSSSFFPHALLGAHTVLPQRFASALAVRFRVAPGPEGARVQRWLADDMYAGKLPGDASEEELLVYVAENFLLEK